MGACTFIIIGVFHPLVIKGEYYFGQRIKWAFVVMGAVTAVGALFTSGVLSCLLAVTAFSSFWSIKEVAEQAERVRKGWFPSNPKRKK